MGKERCRCLGILITLLFMVLFFPANLRCAFYKYVDKDGKIYFVDDKSKIPREYIDDLEVYKEKYDHLPEEERKMMIERDRREREEARKRQQEEREREERLRREKREQEEAERRLAEERRKAAEAKESLLKSLQTEVTVIGNQVLVPVILGYEKREIKATFLFDTGATIVLLHKNIADQLRIKGTRRGRAQLAGGQTASVRYGKLSYMKVGPYERKDIYVSIMKHEGSEVLHDGLLGMNFLRGIEYRIDFQNHMILWEPDLLDEIKRGEYDPGTHPPPSQ